jgi:protein associated with RNAse G/E
VTLRAGAQVRVRLAKRTHPDIEYSAIVLGDDGDHLIVRAPWAETEARDLGYVRFEPGDVFTEHYWRDRWYSIKEVRGQDGALKGWYCDVARPVQVRADEIVSDDLDLDLWCAADGQTILRLDEEDFVESRLIETDADAARRARLALDELERLARAGFRRI